MQSSDRASVAVLSIFTLLGSGAAFTTQILIARALGPSEFGIFASALATVTAAAPLAGFGVQSFWLRVFGEEGWGARRWMPASLRFGIWSTFSALCLVSVVGLLAGASSHAGASLLILQFHLLSMAFLEIIGTRFLLEERPLALMLWQTAPQFARLGLVSLLLCKVEGLDAQAMSWAFALVAVITLVAGWRHLNSLARGEIKLVGHGPAGLLSGSIAQSEVPRMIEAGKGALPYGMGGIFYQFYFQASIVSLTYLLGSAAAGTYGAAASILMAVYMVPNVVYQKMMLPRLHRWAAYSQERYLQAHARGVKLMAGLGSLAGLGCAVTSPFVIPLIFGDQYGQAGILLSGLSVAIPLRFVSISVGASLSLDCFVRPKVAAMFAVAAICVGLNLICIPVLGLWGAVLSTVAGEATLVAFYLWLARTLRPGWGSQ